MSVSSRSLTMLADALRQERRARRTRWRRLDPGEQALLVLAYLRKRETYADLAGGFGIGLTTVFRYIREALDVLAAMAVSLDTAIEVARRKAFVIVDGTLLRTDRVGMTGGHDRPFYSGKHKRHGLNVQVLANPAGRLIWSSPALPGARHDMGAARKHGLLGALEASGVRVIADSAVARQLGVAVPTLRSWDRRYGLGPSEHDPGQHRRYTGQDLARLRRMISLTGEGSRRREPPASHQEDEEVPARDGGGSGTVAVGRAGRAVRGMERVATRLDAIMMRSKVESHLQQRGALRTWEELLIPLLRSIGDNGAQEVAETVAIEHTATLGILTALHGVRPVPERGRLPALLTCAPDEQHRLPLEALHAALAQERCSSRLLGAACRLKLSREQRRSCARKTS